MNNGLSVDKVKNVLAWIADNRRYIDTKKLLANEYVLVNHLALHRIIKRLEDQGLVEVDRWNKKRLRLGAEIDLVTLLDQKPSMRSVKRSGWSYWV